MLTPTTSGYQRVDAARPGEISETDGSGVRPFNSSEKAYITISVLLMSFFVLLGIASAFAFTMPSWNSNNKIKREIEDPVNATKSAIDILNECLHCNSQGGVDVRATMDVDGDARELQQFTDGYNAVGLTWADETQKTATLSNRTMLFSFDRNIGVATVANPARSFTSVAGGRPAGAAGIEVVDESIDKQAVCSLSSSMGYDASVIAAPSLYVKNSVVSSSQIQVCTCSLYFRDTNNDLIGPAGSTDYGEWCMVMGQFVSPP